jgi:dTDP-4-dehydrorhamnose 3,5-epimerase
MEFQPLRLAGTFLIKPKPIGDARGYFMESYRRDKFAAHGLVTDWAQENQALSTRKHVLRGLHFQFPPHTETKLFRALKGRVLDVFVDLRKDSPTYGEWDSVELTEENHHTIYIPKGFGHGYCTLTDTALVAYKVDEFYAPDAQGGLMWNDADLAIDWPTTDPLLSEKDRKLPPFATFESPF